MDYYAFMCSAQVESKTRLLIRQRKLMNDIVCFGIKKKGHRILSCPNFQAEPQCSGKIDQTGIEDRSYRSITSLALMRNMETKFKGHVASKTRHGLQRAKQRQKKKNKCPWQKEEYATLIDSRDILSKIVEMVTSLNPR
jgi:hypothetical protein